MPTTNPIHTLLLDAQANVHDIVTAAAKVGLTATCHTAGVWRHLSVVDDDGRDAYTGPLLPLQEETWKAEALTPDGHKVEPVGYGFSWRANFRPM